MFKRFLQSAFCDFVKYNALGIFKIQHFFQMKRDGLSLAVFVCRQNYFVCFLSRRLQRFYRLAGFCWYDVGGSKIVFNVNAELALGEIANMSKGRQHLILFSKKAFDGA